MNGNRNFNNGLSFNGRERGRGRGRGSPYESFNRYNGNNNNNCFGGDNGYQRYQGHQHRDNGYSPNRSYSNNNNNNNNNDQFVNYGARGRGRGRGNGPYNQYTNVSTINYVRGRGRGRGYHRYNGNGYTNNDHSNHGYRVNNNSGINSNPRMNTNPRSNSNYNHSNDGKSINSWDVNYDGNGNLVIQQILNQWQLPVVIYIISMYCKQIEMLFFVAFSVFFFFSDKIEL